MLDKSEKELPWPSERYASGVGWILDLFKDGTLERLEAIERIALIEPDCDMDDCNQAVSMPLCRECDRIMNMED